MLSETTQLERNTNHRALFGFFVLFDLDIIPLLFFTKPRACMGITCLRCVFIAMIRDAIARKVIR